MHPKSAFSAVLAIAAAVLCGSVLAQTYPSKPVRLIVTYPPGGSSDLMGRVLGQKLSELWGQQVLIESKPGAAGSIGMEFAARQPADGYSFVIGNFGPVAVNPVLSKVPYDVQKDFLPVSMVCTGPNILVVNVASADRSVQELVASAKKEPGRINFGTSGPGSMSHLVGEMFKRSAGIDIVGVQYKGGVLAVQDLLGGQVQMIFSDALPVMQHIRSGKLRPIGITSKDRSPLSPGHPDHGRTGFPGPRGGELVGRAGPRWHAAADRGEAERGPRESARGPRSEDALRAARRRAGIEHARILGRLHPRRVGPLREADQGGRDQGGVRAFRPLARATGNVEPRMRC